MIAARLAVATVLLSWAVPAAAVDQPLVIAIYAPNAPFEGGDARYSYVQRFASHIRNVAGVPTKGMAFARAGDFDTAVRKGRVDFAILDPVYLAAHGGLKVIAISTTSGRTAQPWALFVGAGVGNFLQLQGKRLTFANASARDLAFIEHALLESEVVAAKFFSGRQGAPDLASAVAAVAMGKADCVLAPWDRGKGLKKLFEAGPVPNPGFVQMKSTVPDATVAAVTRAVIGFGVGAALDGWRLGNADPYRVLAGRMGARSRKAAMSEPDLVKLESQEVLLLENHKTVLPPLQQYFWNP